MSYEALLTKFAEMNGHKTHHLFFDLVKRTWKTGLEKVYMKMLNQPLSKEEISLEFLKARVPFPLVVGLGDLDVAKNMIINGVDVKMPTIRNYRALHMACYQGNIKMAELLLQTNADDVNALDGVDRSPLKCLLTALDAKWYTDVDLCYHMTRLLVSYGAKLDSDNMDAMAEAVNHANLDTVKLLVNEANGDLRFRSELDGNTCLHSVMFNKQPGVLEYVIEVFKRENMNLDSTNEWDDTPLLIACQPNVQNHKAVKMLLKLGANFNHEGQEEKSSFDLLIAGERNPELAWLYFDLGLDILDQEVISLYRAVKYDSLWLQDIIAEIAKREMMGAPIVGINQQVFNRYIKKTKRYLNLCKKQLREMQKTKFYENVSFWDVLTADKTRLMEYAENFELVKAFFDIKCNGAFPIYCARIKHKLFEVMSRNSLIDLSTYVVCEAMKHTTIYEIMQHEVMVYMKDDDFLKILACCPKA